MKDNTVIVIDNSCYLRSYAEDVPFKATIQELFANSVIVVSEATGKEYELHLTSILEFNDIEYIKKALNLVDVSVPIPAKDSPIDRLVEVLNNDLDYRQGWIANISMAFKDQFTYNDWDDYFDRPTGFKAVETPESIHEKANKAAEAFIDMLCRGTEK